EFKLDVNAAGTLVAGTGNIPDAVDLVNRLFERLGNLRFDDVCIGARIIRTNRNLRRIYRRKFAHAQISKPDNAKKHDGQVHYNRKNGSANTRGGNAHVVFSLTSFTRTSAPFRNDKTPVVSTVSP